MKKIVILLCAAAFAVCANAKDTATLVSEYKALTGSGSELFHKQRNFAAENKSDILAYFNEWKTTDNAKMSFSEVCALAPSDETESRIGMRKMMAKLYDFAYSEMDASDLVICQLGSSGYIHSKTKEWYQSIKSANFVVDGKALNANNKFQLMYWFKDTEYARTIPLSEATSLSVNYLNNWAKMRAKVLLSMTDKKAAYNEAVSIQDALMFINGSDSALSLITKVQDEIYLRIKRASTIN